MRIHRDDLGPRESYLPIIEKLLAILGIRHREVVSLNRLAIIRLARQLEWLAAQGSKRLTLLGDARAVSHQQVAVTDRLPGLDTNSVFAQIHPVNRRHVYPR